MSLIISTVNVWYLSIVLGLVAAALNLPVRGTPIERPKAPTAPLAA